MVGVFLDGGPRFAQRVLDARLKFLEALAPRFGGDLDEVGEVLLLDGEAEVIHDAAQQGHPFALGFEGVFHEGDEGLRPNLKALGVVTAGDMIAGYPDSGSSIQNDMSTVFGRNLDAGGIAPRFHLIRFTSRNGTADTPEF